jgi:hypothetical protein
MDKLVISNKTLKLGGRSLALLEYFESVHLQKEVVAPRVNSHL